MTQAYLARFGKAMALPTDTHRRAAEAVTDYWSGDEHVQAVLLTCSCARGQAAPTSCVDMSVLVAPERLASFRAEALPAFWRWHHADPACQALEEQVPWSGIDLYVTDGMFQPAAFPHHYTSGPDMFEVEIGNTLAWTHPLLQRGSRYGDLAGAWLPYYDEDLAQKRLGKNLHFARNNLDHIASFGQRGLAHQAFQRLYHALGEYLQALMIHERVYPIAYNKWVREQLSDILGRPALYDAVTEIIASPSLAAPHLTERAQRLGGLLDALDCG